MKLNVDVLVTAGSPGALAAKQATSTIPIVLAAVGDPVAAGIVDSLARPEGNVTGLTFFFVEICAKRVELIKEAIPGLSRIAVLINPANPSHLLALSAMQGMASALRPCEPFAIVVLKLRLGVIKRRCATIRFDAGMARTDHDDRPEPRCICRRWRAVSVNSADLSATIDDGVILVI